VKVGDWPGDHLSKGLVPNGHNGRCLMIVTAAVDSDLRRFWADSVLSKLPPEDVIVLRPSSEGKDAVLLPNLDVSTELCM
jgi:hypothetical protein